MTSHNDINGDINGGYGRFTSQDVKADTLLETYLVETGTWPRQKGNLIIFLSKRLVLSGGIIPFCLEKE